MATANEPDQAVKTSSNFETFIREQGRRAEYEAVFKISFVPSIRAVAVQQGDGSAALWR
jgi:hypothetical protein